MIVSDLFMIIMRLRGSIECNNEEIELLSLTERLVKLQGCIHKMIQNHPRCRVKIESAITIKREKF